MDRSGSTDSALARRQLVGGYLSDCSAEIGGMFEVASNLAQDRQPSGWVHLVAHAGRELMNRLADYVSDIPIEDPGIKRGPDNTAIERRLREGLSGNEADLRDAVARLVEELGQGGGATERRATALLERAQGDLELSQGDTLGWVSAWKNLQSRFVQWTHVRRPNAPSIVEEEVVGAWSELVDLLATRIAREPFFESLGELLDLARDSEPDIELVRGALARLRPGTKVRFYEELSDPLWVKHLDSLGVFGYPPAAVRHDEMISFPGWPEGQILFRFARRAPGATAAAAVGVPPSDNLRVAEILALTAAELPPELAADCGLVARVLDDLRRPFQLFDLVEPACRLARNLVSAGRLRKAREILSALLWIDYFSEPSRSELLPDRTVARYRHDDYLLRGAVPAILDDFVAADGRKTVESLTVMLAKAQEQLAYSDSSQWRSSIEGTRSRSGGDVRHLLLDLLRDACVTLASRDDDELSWVLEHLKVQESVVFERLRLHVMSRFPDPAWQCANLTEPDILFSRELIPEVFRLLPSVFGKMEDSDRGKLLDLIYAGPEPEPWMTSNGIGTGEVDAWKDEWRQRWLIALESMLDTEGQERLNMLRAQRGSVQQPDQWGRRGASWISPTSPVSAAGLAAMNQDDLLQLLRDFSPKSDFASPTREGLRRELESAVEQNPDGWGWLAEHFDDIPPIYVRGWLSGMKGAVAAGTGCVEVGRVLSAIQFAFHQVGDPGMQQQGSDEDVDFYLAQRSAADLLICLLEHDQLKLELREQVWRLVVWLAGNADPTPEREAAADTEPFLFSLSSLRPCGAAAVVGYLQWLDRRLPESERPGKIGFTAVQETKPVLEQLICLDQSPAVRATLAVRLPVLAALDRDWLVTKTADLCDPSGHELARLGWEAYIQYANVHGNAVAVLRDAYNYEVSQLGSASPEIDDLRRRFADHVAVIWRDLPEVMPNLFRDFLTVAPDADRARAMRTLWQALVPSPEEEGGYEPSDDDLDRHTNLWDARLSVGPGPLEMSEFGWWWTTGRFRGESDIRRFTKTLRNAKAQLGDLHGAVELLGDLVEENPSLIGPSLDALDVINELRVAAAQHVRPSNLSTILESALADPTHRERAASLVHEFGEQGYLDLRRLLD